MTRPKGEQCPLCNEGHLRVTHNKQNQNKEYRWIYKECRHCKGRLNYYEFHEHRAKELLRYEKAYWKMREILDKYY